MIKSGKIFLFCLLLVSLLQCVVVGQAFADIYVNILAINGTDEEKTKEVHEELPLGLTSEDILDSAGLKVGYNAGKSVYYIHGQVTLQPKETKTYKILIRDIWRIDEESLGEIKQQIDDSLKRIQGTDYYEVGEVKKASLLQRLDFINSQQEEFADDIEKRISRYQTYAQELEDIRNDALSVKYWRSRPPAPDKSDIISFIVEVENKSENYSSTTAQARHYLPPEVKPEHIVESEGFDILYDPFKQASYLKKEETLQPSEIKRYIIGIIDVWNIDQILLDDLKDRTSKAYKLLENSQYGESAGFLVASIKKHITAIEESQAQEKEISQHINAHRENLKLFEKAEQDVITLEEMLEAIRETLERSKLKNVLKRAENLKSIVEIAKSVFKRPQINTAWKIIFGIVVFVGIFTTIHFIIWNKRSKAAKKEEEQEKSTDGE